MNKSRNKALSRIWPDWKEIGIAIIIALVMGKILLSVSIPITTSLCAGALIGIITYIRFEYGLYFILLVSATGGFIGFDLPGAPPIYLVELLLGMLLFLWFIMIMLSPDMKSVSSPLKSPLFLLIIWSLIAATYSFFSKDLPFQQSWRLQFMGIFLLVCTIGAFFMFTSILTNLKTIKYTVFFILLSSIPPILIQYMLYLKTGTLRISYTDRVESFWGGNFFGAYYILCLILSLSLLRLVGNVKKFLISVYNIFLVGGILITFARTSLVIMFISVLFFYYLRSKKIFILLIISLLLIVLFFPPLLSVLRHEYRFEQFSTGLGHWDRITLFTDAMKIVKKYPVFGIGFLPYGFFSDFWLSKMGSTPHFYGFWGSAHNDYMQIAVDLGLVGLIIYIYFLFLCWRETFFLYKSSNDIFTRTIATAFLAILCNYTLQSLASEAIFGCLDNGGLQNLSVRIYFWVLLAVIFGLKHIEKEKRKEVHESPKDSYYNS